MTDRETFLCDLDFERSGQYRPMEFMGFWPETIERWKKEGHIREDEDIFQHFGLCKQKAVPIDFNCIPAFEKRIIEETEEYIVASDECNCIKKEMKNSSAMPEYLDFPIKNRKDFYEFRERMDPLSLERYPVEWTELTKEYSNRDYPLGVVVRGPFAFCRDFIKFNDLMLLFYDDMQLIKEMMDFQGEFIIRLWERVFRDVKVDYIYIGEDMAYKNVTMVSPSMIQELVIPVYKRINSFFRDNGIKNILLDSDGNIQAIIPMVIESGFTGILPLENAAGMDPEKIREKYPTLKMIGGINKLNIAEGKDGIAFEVQKAVNLIRKGGYIPSLDHSVPPIISYENYSYYIQMLCKEIGCVR